MTWDALVDPIDLSRVLRLFKALQKKTSVTPKEEWMHMAGHQTVPTTPGFSHCSPDSLVDGGAEQ